MSERLPSVVLVDDHPVFRGGLRQVLEAGPVATVLGEAAHARDALDLVGRLRPDVVLLDLEMPGTDGLALLPALLDACPALRVVVVSHRTDERAVRGALEGGASGYLAKTARPGEIQDAVREVAAGNTYVHASLAGRLLRTGGNGGPPPCPLNSRELEILERIAAGRSLAEAAADLHLAHGTVKTYLSTVYSKLQVRDLPQAMVVVMREGWLG